MLKDNAVHRCSGKTNGQTLTKKHNINRDQRRFQLMPFRNSDSIRYLLDVVSFRTQTHVICDSN